MYIGALYANNGGLEKAVADFEAALHINPQHQNAKKYLCETLIAVARNYEDDSKVGFSITEVCTLVCSNWMTKKRQYGSELGARSCRPFA